MSLQPDFTANLADNFITEDYLPSADSTYFLRYGAFYDRDFQVVAHLENGETLELSLNDDVSLFGGSSFNVTDDVSISARLYCGFRLNTRNFQKIVVTARFAGILVDAQAVKQALTHDVVGLNLAAVKLQSTKYHDLYGATTKQIRDFQTLSDLMALTPLFRVSAYKDLGETQTTPLWHKRLTESGVDAFVYRGYSEKHPTFRFRIDEINLGTNEFLYLEMYATPDNGVSWERYWVTEPLRQHGQVATVMQIPDDRKIKAVIRSNDGTAFNARITCSVIEHFPSDIGRLQVFDYRAEMTSSVSVGNTSESVDLSRASRISAVVRQTAGAAGSVYAVEMSDAGDDWATVGTITMAAGNATGRFMLADAIGRKARIRCTNKANGAINEFVVVAGQN